MIVVVLPSTKILIPDRSVKTQEATKNIYKKWRIPWPNGQQAGKAPEEKNGFEGKMGKPFIHSLTEF